MKDLFVHDISFQNFNGFKKPLKIHSSDFEHDVLIYLSLHQRSESFHSA